MSFFVQLKLGKRGVIGVRKVLNPIFVVALGSLEYHQVIEDMDQIRFWHAKAFVYFKFGENTIHRFTVDFVPFLVGEGKIAVP